MDWAEPVARYIIPPAVLGLIVTTMKLWKASNPTRQEEHYKKVHSHDSLLTAHGLKLDEVERRMVEGRDHGDRLTRVEAEVRHIREDTGEMKADVKELLKHARANGGT